MVVVDLVKNASASGCERTVVHAWGPTGIGRREALLAALALLVVADDEVALHHIHLFPVVVHERLGGEGARLDLQQPGAASELVDLVEVPGEGFFVENPPGGPAAVPTRGFPQKTSPRTPPGPKNPET